MSSLLNAGDGADWGGAPEGTAIGHVHLHVGDLAGAEAFYHRALGFDKTVWSYPGALFFSAGGYHHHLGSNIWPPGPSGLVVLLNEHTLSASEMVAAFAHENGFAEIVGTQTAGQVLRGANFSVGQGFLLRFPAAA